MTKPAVIGMTFMLRTGSTSEAVAFYRDLLGRDPDYSPHEDFHEWQVSPDAWLQVATGASDIAPSSFRLRFQVRDLATAVQELRTRGVKVDEPTTLPGVAAFTNFADPWGNPLGFYQDVATGQGPVVPGGSAKDEALFQPGIVTSNTPSM